MIYKRVAARLSAQDWVAITIELAIVVVGVFVGTWVADWNQARVEAGETRRMLINLKPELENSVGYDQTIENYYVLTHNYATTAFAGWRGTRGFPTATSSSLPIRRARQTMRRWTRQAGLKPLAPSG